MSSRNIVFKVFNDRAFVLLNGKPTQLPNFDYKANNQDFYDLDSDNFDIEQQNLLHLIDIAKKIFRKHYSDDVNAQIFPYDPVTR